jgi:hypothetical protein
MEITLCRWYASPEEGCKPEAGEALKAAQFKARGANPWTLKTLKAS